MSNLRLSILVILILIGLVSRVFMLGSLPAGFTWDEAALGYNAYSLLLTGKDEYGSAFPVVLKSFGDYKPGLYAYLTVPAVKLLGLNEFATRLPSAVFGVLIMVLVFLLVARLFTFRAALFTIGLVAVNPWLIHFSRGAWEANLSLCLSLAGLLLLLKYLRRRSLSAVCLAGLFFGLTLWSYQGAKLFTPLIIAVFVWRFFTRTNYRQAWAGLAVLVLLALPLLQNFFSQSGRLSVLNMFAYQRTQAHITALANQDRLNPDSPSFLIFHAEIIDQLRGLSQRALNHLSPRFLFIAGDWSNLRHTIPYYGYFHIPEAALMLVGICVVFIRHRRIGLFLASYAAVAILPSALSRDIVSGVRSLNLAVPLVVLAGIGLASLPRLVRILAVFSLIFFFLYYLDLNFVHSRYFQAQAFVYPYKQAVSLVQSHLNDYRRVIFSPVLGQPYIFVLFYSAYPPANYQGQASLHTDGSADVGSVLKLDKYDFIPVDWRTQRGDSSTIFVGTEFELPEQDMNPDNLVRLAEIYYPNRAHALRVVALQ